MGTFENNEGFSAGHRTLFLAELKIYLTPQGLSEPEQEKSLHFFA